MMLLLLAACVLDSGADPLDPIDSGDSRPTGGGCGDRRADCIEPGWDPATDIGVVWDHSDGDGELFIQISRGSPWRFSLGIAETAAGEAGWYGEDGRDESTRHVFYRETATLAYAPGDGVPGQSTAFDGGSDGIRDAWDADGGHRLTYAVFIRDGNYAGTCYVWGHDIAWYADLSCTAL